MRPAWALVGTIVAWKPWRARSDIDDIDDVNQRFSVDMFMIVTWHDPRLAVVHDVESPIPLYYLEPVTSFRSAYAYDNILYHVAALVIWRSAASPGRTSSARGSSSPWEWPTRG